MKCMFGQMFSLGMVSRVHFCISTAIKLFRGLDSLSSGLKLIIKCMFEQMFFNLPFALRFFCFFIEVAQGVCFILSHIFYRHYFKYKRY